MGIDGEDCKGSLEVLGLGRPGGGPEREAMPGAEAQQAREEVGVFMKKGNRERMWGGGENTQRERGWWR